MNYTHFFENQIGLKKLKWTGNQGIGCCPLPYHNDENPSFSMNRLTGQCYCFSCDWKGNVYLLAKELNMDNPHQWIDSANTYSNNSEIVQYEQNNNLKIDSVSMIEVKKKTKYNELKKRYGSRVNLGDNYKDKYVGKSDLGEDVFIYPKGIKIHKKYWIKEASMDTSNQIFMVDELEHFDKNRIYLLEGEKDALSSARPSVSFSCGASSIPKDITSLYDFSRLNEFSNCFQE